MIKKRENCLYCGEKMESKTAKKKFCSDLHRLYYNRELKRGTLSIHAKLLEEIKTEKIEYISPRLPIEILDLPKVKEKHPKYKNGDPSEKTNAFYLKYGAFTYDEIEN